MSNKRQGLSEIAFVPIVLVLIIILVLVFIFLGVVMGDVQKYRDENIGGRVAFYTSLNRNDCSTTSMPYKDIIPVAIITNKMHQISLLNLYAEGSPIGSVVDRSDLDYNSFEDTIYYYDCYSSSLDYFKVGFTYMIYPNSGIEYTEYDKSQYMSLPDGRVVEIVSKYSSKEPEYSEETNL